ncbi:hypothetical protein W97_01284 [Coniosporium apollinis CBS 100218]|uniref:Deoxyuridine 5'-triphosphate nucleotidohydrolase n=1 Tax=Coniosporium apollinis (strain CBS 100218) TaxID=1168221 RepID=R7YJJ5_CONA1|nr:uncharacterized protein W97_01284 [Coniosporium apollinis CBS 100218]EON62065.1 hypothetical protein W97_01284 [Coniosporium apollinis CBS 100218]
MADETAATPSVTHEPPSLPASPLPKRTKVIDAALAGPFPTDSGTATPTPLAMSTSASSALYHATSPATMGVKSAPKEAPIPVLQVQKLSEKGRTPTRASALAAGYDVYSAREAVIPARGWGMVDTDVAVGVPAGTYGRIAPRSGLAAKHGIGVNAGVIDADYTGHVRVILMNFSDKDFEVKEGDRIAQLIVERIYTPEIVEVEQLQSSDRGAGGFGSTGGFGGVISNGA